MSRCDGMQVQSYFSFYLDITFPRCIIYFIMILIMKLVLYSLFPYDVAL